MKATDYIIRFLISKGVTDLFGYPGGVICHLMDSARKYQDRISCHTTYHEQAAALAACGYAQASHRLGVAYATSGPGATNLVTGIANAYFDSLPVMFLTGQVDTYAGKGGLRMRQKGFQETDIVSMTECVTKRSIYVESAQRLPEYLEEAYRAAMSGRPGPVLLDLPADVQRAEIAPVAAEAAADAGADADGSRFAQSPCDRIFEELARAERPCILAGAGILQCGMASTFRRAMEKLGVPVVTSMPAIGLLPFAHPLQFGFIGANGHRCANFILEKSDLVISIGSRLDSKQVGNRRDCFAAGARLLRIDIDREELAYPVRPSEEQVTADLRSLLPELERRAGGAKKASAAWRKVCAQLKRELYEYDYDEQHRLIAAISGRLPQRAAVLADCGQSQVWVAQSIRLGEDQTLLTTSGLGCMGYSLPAAIGAYYATRRPVISFCGDGGLQMNIQELQFVARNHLPVKIIVLNNRALGMIRHFQEKNFDANYYQTTSETGYAAPSFVKLAQAYGIPAFTMSCQADADRVDWEDQGPLLIEVPLPETTYLYPGFAAGRPISDAAPFLPREQYMKYMEF